MPYSGRATKKELEEHIQFITMQYIESSRVHEQKNKLIGLLEEKIASLEADSDNKSAMIAEVSSMYREAWNRCPVKIRHRLFDVPTLEGKACMQ